MTLYNLKITVAAERLAEATDAKAVILFGSRARGDNDEDSDWDLCVLLPDDVPFGKYTPLTLWPIVSNIGLPIQVVALRECVFKEDVDDVNSMSYDIDRDGVVIIGSKPRVYAA